ncbi:membrane protein [Marivirga tractuosa]|uniref:Outer membrane efflux protein n=1 Tax=Marivirga tractuosa (strain ATCC 23168 / DSM 4126 / NBRC 15989 / NCIMB 1408 / VKM B-1430 / H-43) TaxID=643867 RepID=E4TUK1_MARTH|nr:TolC family protein [Marivirga tractuosa]ADR23094.1 outer membrane efflux protein [Marivirga tractuosa DSM 4126]BDD16232.1 membrane protein [Marivirga tractuosa]
MNRKYFYTIIIITCFSFIGHHSFAQKTYTLQDVIQIAKTQSPAYKRAETIKENRYWQYRVYKSNFVPQLSLSGTVPNFNRSVTPITQEDGSTEYRSVFNSNSDVSLNLEQQIGLTGGTIFLNSTVNRFDDFERNNFRYGGDPLSVGFIQPLFRFNELKWDKKIEPLRFEESKREFVEEFEQISKDVTTRFFNLLSAQVSLEIAQKNLGNNDTIYKIAQGRYELGKIPENELLQLELSLMNSRQAVAQAKLDLETTQLALKAFLGLKNNDELNLVVPEDVPLFEIDADIALQEALNNRQEAIGFKRRLLEADKEVDRAQGETGLNMDLYGSFGLTNQAEKLPAIYQTPENQQRVQLGFSIPIVDWGRQKSRVKTAEANYQLVQYTVEQERVNFEQEVYTQVRTLEMLRDQVAITQKADDISQRRYNIAKNRYLIGKISITDLSIALTEKDQAKRDYINSLGNFWQAYYNLRQLTLYDFRENRRLIE